MKDVSSKEGRTVLFVSHNLPAVKKLCTRGIYLHNGQLSFTGNVSDVVSLYFNEIEERSTMFVDENTREGNGRVRLSGFQIAGSSTFEVNEPVKFLFKLNKPFDKSRLIVSFSLYSPDHQLLSYLVSDETRVLDENPKSEFTDHIELSISNFTFRPGRYTVRIILHDTDTSYENTCDIVESAMKLDILSNDFFGSGKVMRSHDQSGLMQGHYNFK